MRERGKVDRGSGGSCVHERLHFVKTNGVVRESRGKRRDRGEEGKGGSRGRERPISGGTQSERSKAWMFSVWEMQGRSGLKVGSSLQLISLLSRSIPFHCSRLVSSPFPLLAT